MKNVNKTILALLIVSLAFIIYMVFAGQSIREETNKEIERLNKELEKIENLMKENEHLIDSLIIVKTKQDEKLLSFGKELDYYKNQPIPDDYTNMAPDSAVREFIRRHYNNRE